MISWMQHNRKYLIVTLWLSAIAFVGAGFVGWGSYKYGSKATAIARIGNVDIKLAELQMAYSNLYGYYNQMFGGKFDKDMAKEMRLEESAFDILKREALLLNLAEEFGLKILDKEIAENIIRNESFFKNGIFDRGQYEAILLNSRITPKEYEDRLAKSILITKLRELMPVVTTHFEKELFGSILTLKDKLEYKILSFDDVNVSLSENDVLLYWESNKNRFLTEPEYQIKYIETAITDKNYTENEQQEFYNANGLKYDVNFSEAKDEIKKDMLERDAKREAMKDYLALKKGESSKELKELQMNSNNMILSEESMAELKMAKIGDILKPQLSINGIFVTVRLENVILPREKSFDEVKSEVSLELKNIKSKEALSKLAQDSYMNFSGKESDFLAVTDGAKIEGIFPQDGSELLSTIFTSSTNQGFVQLDSKIVLYKILQQKVDKEGVEDISEQMLEVKERVFEDNLIKRLEYYYPIQTYFKG